MRSFALSIASTVMLVLIASSARAQESATCTIVRSGPTWSVAAVADHNSFFSGKRVSVTLLAHYVETGQSGLHVAVGEEGEPLGELRYGWKSNGLSVSGNVTVTVPAHTDIDAFILQELGGGPMPPLPHILRWHGATDLLLESVAAEPRTARRHAYGAALRVVDVHWADGEAASTAGEVATAISRFESGGGGSIDVFVLRNGALVRAGHLTFDESQLAAARLATKDAVEERERRLAAGDC